MSGWKLNRRTRWKYAKARVLDMFDEDFASPASFGPAGRRHVFFFGGISDETISARSKQHYWERLDRYIATLPLLTLDRIRKKRQAQVDLWNKLCDCGTRYGSHSRRESRACGIDAELGESEEQK